MDKETFESIDYHKKEEKIDLKEIKDTEPMP